VAVFPTFFAAFFAAFFAPEAVAFFLLAILK
jgi:hypothetical protein